MPVCFNYGRETPVKLYGGPEIHACHRVGQHYSCQSEVVVVVVVVMMIITIITILLALQRTRFTATFNLFCRGDLARNHQVPVVQTLDSAIYRINLYPVDSAIGFPNTYPLDSDLSDG